MHILSIDQFNEKLTATSISLSDLSSLKKKDISLSSSEKQRLKMIDSVSTKIHNNRNNQIVTSIDDKKLEIHTQPNTTWNNEIKYYATIKGLNWIYSKGYELLFDDNADLYISSGIYGCMDISYAADFYKCLLSNNHFNEITFEQIGIDYHIRNLVAQCYIESIKFKNCQFDSLDVLDKNEILSVSVNKDIEFKSENKFTISKLKKSGWNI